MNARTTLDPLAGALDCLARGFYVFPVEADGKAALVRDWPNVATADEKQVRAWAAQFPGCNFAIVPGSSGLFVLDLDRKNGKDGVADLEALEREHGFDVPDSLAVRTPSDGFHLYLRGAAPPSAGRIAPGIDIRGTDASSGKAGYVLAPGSRINGRSYVIENDNVIEAWEIPPAPPKLIELATSPKHGAQSAPADIKTDAPSALDRARAFLKDRAPATEGSGGDSWTFQTAAHLRDFGISEDRAKELLIETGWNALCVPPWTEDELAVKVGNAFAYGQNDPGANAVPNAAEIFGHLIPTEPTEAPAHVADVRAIVLRSEAMQDSRTPPKMLIDGFLPEIGTVAIHAPFGSFKSFTAADALLSVAANRPAFNHYPVRRAGVVLYMAGEGLAGFETLRRPAWRAARNVPEGCALPIFTIDSVPLVRSPDDIKRYIDAIGQLKQRPTLIAIDPVARAMAGLNENDAGDAGLYLEMVEAMAKTFGCCVLSVMHEGKEGERGIRGSSAFAAGFDNVWKQEADTDATTAKLSPIKLKDDAGIGAICLKGRQVLVPRAGKTSLVFDWMPADEFAGRGSVLTRSEVGRALMVLAPIGSKPVTTHVLASELAGPDADAKAVATVEKRLRRGLDKFFRAFVVQKGEGRGDATLWAFPATDEAEATP